MALEQGNVASAYLLTGDSDYWAGQWLSALRQRVLGKEQDEWSLFEGSIAWQDVKLRLATSSFFQTGRVVIVREGRFSNKEKVVHAYLEAAVRDSVLVLWEKKPSPGIVKAMGSHRIVEAKSLPEKNFMEFTRLEVKRRHLSLDASALKEFCSLVAFNEHQALFELDKMMLFNAERPWTVEDISKWVTPFQQDTKLWRLTDAILEKKALMAITLTQQLLQEGKAPIMILVVISRFLGQLLRGWHAKAARQTVEGFSQEEGIRSFAAQKLWRNLSKWKENEISTALMRALELDKAFKTGYGDPVAWLGLYVALVSGNV